MAARYPGIVKSCRGTPVSYDASSGRALTLEHHLDSGNVWLWDVVVVFGRFRGFEQSYPTCRVLLCCGHLSVAIGPHGQLSHAVAQGESFEPRCAVLLMLHLEMIHDGTEHPMDRFTGFCGCKGPQPGLPSCFWMGFEQGRSSKSRARNTIENALRLHYPQDGSSSSWLREVLVDVCLGGDHVDAALLLTDVVILDELTRDLRKARFQPEHVIREALSSSLMELLLKKASAQTAASVHDQLGKHLWLLY